MMTDQGDSIGLILKPFYSCPLNANTSLKILFASRMVQICPSASPGASVTINVIKPQGTLFLRWKHSSNEIEPDALKPCLPQNT